MANKWLTQFLKDDKNTLAATTKPKQVVYLQSPSYNWAMPLKMGETTCLYGPEGSGKSLISMLAIGALHQADPTAIAVLISTEYRAPDPDRLRVLGVDPERLLIRQASAFNDVFDWILSKDEKFTNEDGTKGGPGLSYQLEQGMPMRALVIDSVKGIQGPRELAADSTSKEIMGDLSKFLNPALRGILPVIRKHDMMTILVQQVNENMDQDEVKYQNLKYKIPSGMALKHFCEVMNQIERVTSKDSKIFDETMQSIREIPVQMGHTIRVKNTKNNTGKPFREAEFRLHYEDGVVQLGREIAELAANLGVISHPINPETGKEISAQWIFKATLAAVKVDRKWIGFATVVEDCEKDPALRRQLMSAVEQMDKSTDTEGQA